MTVGAAHLVCRGASRCAALLCGAWAAPPGTRSVASRGGRTAARIVCGRQMRGLSAVEHVLPPLTTSSRSPPASQSARPSAP
eukprot:1336877-Alexandrium_andersonii.AAC.1